MGRWGGGKVGEFSFYSRVGDERQVKDFLFFMLIKGTKRGRIGSRFSAWLPVFPYENHCKCYKKLVSILWSMLFTVTNFFLSHTHSILWQNKKLLQLLLSLANLSTDHYSSIIYFIYTYIYTYIYKHVCMYVYIYIYIYIDR